MGRSCTVQASKEEPTTLDEDAPEIQEEIKELRENLQTAASGINALNVAIVQAEKTLEESKQDLQKSPRLPRKEEQSLALPETNETQKIQEIQEIPKSPRSPRKEEKSLSLPGRSDESKVEALSRKLDKQIQETQEFQGTLIDSERQTIEAVNEVHNQVPKVQQWVQQNIQLADEGSPLINDLEDNRPAQSRSQFLAQGLAMINRGLLAVNSLITSCLSFAHVVESDTAIGVTGGLQMVSGGLASVATIGHLWLEWKAFRWKDFFSLKFVGGTAAVLKPFVDALSALLHILAAQHTITAWPAQVGMLASNVCALTNACVSLYQERKKSRGDDSPSALCCANPNVECGMQGSAIATHLTGIAFNPLVATMIGATGVGGQVAFGVGTMVAAFFSIVVLIFFCVILVRWLREH
jgi:hypothetical protein